MEFLADYASFLAKTVTLVIAIVVASLLVGIAVYVIFGFFCG